MRSAAFSIKVFGVYAALAGFGLLFAPAVMLSMLGFPETSDFWVRAFGALAAVVGFYYWTCGAANLRTFFVASLYGRAAFFLLCIALVLTGAPRMLIVLGLVDAVAASWTLYALRAESGSA